MMSTKSSGSKIEKIARDILVSQGYAVQLAQRTMKRVPTAHGIIYVSSENDFFNVFDLIAISETLPVRMIQTTALGHGSHRKAKIEDAVKSKSIPINAGISYEVWEWAGGRRRKDKTRIHTDGRWILAQAFIQYRLVSRDVSYEWMRTGIYDKTGARIDELFGV